jgi:hypothetical protein
MFCIEGERESAGQAITAFSIKPLFIVVSVWLSSSVAFAQATFRPPETPLEIRSQKVSGSITIDGALDEPAWQNVKPIADLVQYEPRQGEAASLKTEVRILFDEKNLCISAICFDSAGRKGIRVPNMQRDFSFDENDLFGIAIDGLLDKRNAAAFQTNPYGGAAGIVNQRWKQF